MTHFSVSKVAIAENTFESFLKQKHVLAENVESHFNRPPTTALQKI